MLNTIVVHSAREGIGKSTIAANVATLLAFQGQRVGIIDADLQSGSMRNLFGLKNSQIGCTLNDYFFDNCDGSQAVYDVSPLSNFPRGGRVFLAMPSSIFSDRAWQKLHETYDIDQFMDKLKKLVQLFQFDTLVIDTHARISDNTVFSILSMAVADVLAVVLKLDHRDYHNTGVIIDLAQSLSVPKIMLIPNQVASSFDQCGIQQQIYEAYNHDVAAVIPYADEIMLMSMSGIFVVKYPEHPVTETFHKLSKILQSK